MAKATIRCAIAILCCLKKVRNNYKIIMSTLDYRLNETPSKTKLKGAVLEQ